jgi:hypothetical protein
MNTSDNLGTTTLDVEVLALAILRSFLKRPDLPEEVRERFITNIAAGSDALTLRFDDFREIARFALAARAVDVEAERAAWRSWYYDPEGYGGKTFGYQDTQDGHHLAFAEKSERGWLERAGRPGAICSAAIGPVSAEPAESPELKIQKRFPADVYDKVDPAYELTDDGLLRHRETGIIRPKWYSGEPIPFKVGASAKVVDGNQQFPLGKIGKITNIEQGVVYFDGEACCWERLDPVPAEQVVNPVLDAATQESLLNLARDADGGASLTHLQDVAAQILGTLAGGRRPRPPQTEADRARDAEQITSYQAAMVGLNVNTEKGFLHDYMMGEFASQAAADALEIERYRWVRQPNNLNCMMFEFKGNTAAQADAYIDKQTGRAERSKLTT